MNQYIEYSGNRNKGHYTATVSKDNKWYSISDSYYHQVEESEMLKSSAKILFYSS